MLALHTNVLALTCEFVQQAGYHEDTWDKVDARWGHLFSKFTSGTEGMMHKLRDRKYLKKASIIHHGS